ncbi:MAG: hypothetical protein M3Q99_14210 [Acidobacteriota bacterium]|nr:hypothetical protein [Acidobacteriota bacterium]
MKKILMLWLIISLIATFIFFFLLIELHSHDPYQWANPNFETVESRNLYNERKILYFYFMVGTFGSFVVSVVVWICQKIKERNSKLH